MSRPVPTLDTSGWVNGVAQKADRIFSYFLISDYSQSLAHRGRISSLPYIISEAGKELSSVKSNTITALSRLFNAYFDEVEVDVTIEDIKDDNGNDTAKVDIRIYVTVTDAGKTHTLGKLVSFVDSKVSKVVDLRYG